MELNEKIAARRRELAIEAENVKKAERDAVEAEVAKRLAEHGIEQPTTIKYEKVKKAENVVVGTEAAAQGAGQNAPSGLSNSAVDAEVERVLHKAASDRTTSRERNVFYTILGVGLISQIVYPWWLLVIFVAWASIYKFNKIAIHKKEILAEGKARRERELNVIGQDRFQQKVQVGPDQLSSSLPGASVTLEGGEGSKVLRIIAGVVLGCVTSIYTLVLPGPLELTGGFDSILLEALISLSVPAVIVFAFVIYSMRASSEFAVLKNMLLVSIGVFVLALGISGFRPLVFVFPAISIVVLVSVVLMHRKKRI